MIKKTEEELNLYEVILSIWNDKFKIILILLITVAFGLWTNSFPKKYLATTEIIPISFDVENKYSSYNHFTKINQLNKNIENKRTDDLFLENIIQNYIEEKKNYVNHEIIDKDFLYSLFLEAVQNKEIFIEPIIKNKLINRDKFTNDLDFNETLNKLLSSIEIVPNSNQNQNQNLKYNDRQVWNINFKTQDKQKWTNILQEVNSKINKKIKYSLEEDFKKKIELEINRNEIALDDIKNQIDNKNMFNKIENENRLAFLSDQALLAKELNIATPSIFQNNKSEKNSTEIINDNNYFLKGYKAIEKEIQLMKSREKQNYIDKNIEILNLRKKSLEDNKFLDRLKSVINETPIKSENFFAANIKYNFTNYKSLNLGLIKTLIISIVVGLIIGVFYVVTLNILKNNLRK